MSPAGRLYPVDHPLFDDRAMLLRAVGFATGQRAYECRQILDGSLANASDMERAYSAVTAYRLRVESTEDILGWFFALRDWEPGTPTKSLVHLVNSIEVGREQYTEQRAVDDLRGVDEGAFRQMIHLPSSDELRGDGFDEGLVQSIERGVGAHLAGIRTVGQWRLESGRGRVRAFNKIKHFLPAQVFRVPPEDIVRVEVPMVALRADGFHITTLWLETDEVSIRGTAGVAYANQAALNALLGAILMTRFDHPYQPPDWLADAERRGTWINDDGPRAP